MALRAPQRQMFEELADVQKAHNVFSLLGGFGELLAADDKIIQEKGRGLLNYYDLMIDSDSVLAGLLETRIGGVSSLNWEIVSASEDDADIEAAEFLRFVFDQIEDFDVALADMLSA